MIIGYDFFGMEDTIAFNNTPSLGSIGRMELSNSIVDEVEIRERTDVQYSLDKDEWTYDTIAIAKFQNNLEAGNINLGGITVDQIKIKKRRINELTWTDLKTFDIQSGVHIYQYVDNLVESAEQYEYAILPIGVGGYEGQYNIEQITCDFEGTFICDKDNIYQLVYDLEYGDIENVVPSTTIETFSQYPIISYSPLDYKRGSAKCTLISEGTLHLGGSGFDITQDKLLRKTIMEFIKNKKPKILKDGSGNYLMIAIIGNPKEIPNNKLNQRVYGIAFDWVEIGNPYTDMV